MESVLSLLSLMVFLPLVGGATLCFTAAIWQTATASSTPRWQRYLWFLGSGYVLVNLRQFAEAIAGNAQNW